MNFNIKSIALAVMAITAMTACTSGGSKKSSGTVVRGTNSTNIAVLACDNSFENIMQQEIDVFEFINPRQNILPLYLDEKSCVDSLIKGRASVAVISRELRPSEIKLMRTNGRNPNTTRIAVDAIALIVNKDNPLNEITVNELRDVLDGKFSMWNQIAPSKLGEIGVVFDDNGSSTVRYMRDSILDGRAMQAKVYAQGDNKAVFEAVKGNRNALGVIGVSWIASDMSGASLTAAQRAEALDKEDVTDMGFSNDIKVLRVRRDDCIDSFQPYQAYILDGSYPLFRSMYMVNTGYSGTAAHAFYVFVTGWRGQKVIMSTGVLPSTVRPRVVSLN